MTEQELARRLDGNEVGSEVSPRDVAAAKEANLAIIYGASDDLVEFEGAIVDEVGAYGGAEIYITKGGVVSEPECGNSECKYFAALRKTATKVTATWNNSGGPCWKIDTENIGGAPFRIYEEDSDEVFCEGLVLSLNNL